MIDVPVGYRLATPEEEKQLRPSEGQPAQPWVFDKIDVPVGYRLATPEEEKQLRPSEGQPAQPWVFDKGDYYRDLNKSLLAPDPSDPTRQEAGQHPVRGLYRQVLQGQTLGLADEAGAGVAAGLLWRTHGAPYGETYRDMLGLIRQEDARFREQNPGTSMTANVMGGITTAIPLFAAGRGAVGGGLAAFGFSEATTPGELAFDTAIGVGWGYVLGKAFMGLGHVGKSILNKWRARGVNLTDKGGKIKDEVIDAIKLEISEKNLNADDLAMITEEMKGVLTPAQLKRMDLFARRGVTPVRANVTQSTDDFRNLQTSIKHSGPLAETIAAQDDQLISAAREGISEMKPTAQNIVETNANVYKVVDDIVSTYESAVSTAYKSAEKAAKGEKVVVYNNLIRVLKDNLGGESKSQGVISALRGDLKQRGLLVKGWKPNRRSDVPAAEEIRQHLNQLQDPAQPYGNTLIRKLKEALDDDVQAAVGEDVFKAARQANIKLKTLIQRGSRNKRDRSRGGFLEDVLNNKIPEEKIVQRLMSGRDDDMLKFKQFLAEEAGEPGKAAWQDIKAQVLRDALESATSTQGKKEGGQAVFNSRLFKNAFKNMRKNKKFDTLFGSEEQSLIDDIGEIGWLRIPQGNVYTGSGASGFSIDQFKHEIFKRLDAPSGPGERLWNFAVNRSDVNRQMNPLKETAEFIARKQAP